MPRPTILVVEDNPITRKLFRVALEQAGYDVLTAHDGATALEQMATDLPDLVLQDLGLPDLGGSELVQHLRAIARVGTVPILAVSGRPSATERVEELRRQGFTDFLSKPVEPSVLVRAVRAYLPTGERRPEQVGQGRSVLLVHDDPIQLKLLKANLEQAGFVVTTADNGSTGLDQAGLSRPAAIVSDVLMPEMDGFRFCQAVRASQELAQVPVVLVSAAFTDEADRQLARKVGASALTVLTPDGWNVVEALLGALAEAPSQPAAPTESLPAEYTERIVRQLDRQAGRAFDLSHRLTTVETELDVLAGLTQVLAKKTRVETILTSLLNQCADAIGISRGAGFLLKPDGRLSLGVQIGYHIAEEPALQDLFGHADLFRAVLATGEPIAVPSATVGNAAADDLLVRARARSLVLAPLVLADERLGVLMLVSEHGDLVEDLGPEWMAFARVIGIQVSQAIGLARAMSRLQQSEERFKFLAMASSRLLDPLDYEERLATLAHLVVPFLADWCVVDAVAADGSLRRVAATHVDPDKEVWIRRLQRDYGPDRELPGVITRVLKTGQSELLAHISNAQLATFARDAEHLEILRRLGTESALIVPLVARGRTVAYVALIRGPASPCYEPSDLSLAEDLAGRAGLAVDNARLYGEAQAASRARDEFLSVAAHELKTPLTSVRGFAQVAIREIDRQDVDPRRLRQALQIIDRQTVKLYRLMTNLLDVAHIESRKLVLDKQVTDVNGLVGGVVAAAQMKTSQHTLTLQASPAVSALVDPIRLEQVVTNLVDNAIKYSPNGGPIDVEVAAPEAGTLRIAVRDHGIGIPPGMRERIFDRYFQAAGGRHAGGMGLGLYISHEIVRLHGGEIIAEFPADGGSRFIVSLPVQ